MSKQSNLIHKAWFDACRELSIIGTGESVPAMAALLINDELSHSARYALETNPDPSVDVALRDAIDKTKGDTLAGIISSIGFRKDRDAVEKLIPLLKSEDAHVAENSARALGSISGREAAGAIFEAMNGASKTMLLACVEGLHRVADSLKERDMNDIAKMVYKRISDSAAPVYVREAAIACSNKL